MTHIPPIPAGNTSPYPLHEPPHAKTATEAQAENGKSEAPSRTPSTMLFLRGGIVVGAAVAVAGLMFARRPKVVVTPKRRTAKATPRAE